MRVEVSPQYFASRPFGGMNRLVGALALVPFRWREQFVHERMVVSRDGHPSTARFRSISEFAVLVFVHLEPVRLIIPARRVQVRRVAVEKRFRAVVEAHHVDCGAVFDLDA